MAGDFANPGWRRRFYCGDDPQVSLSGNLMAQYESSIISRAAYCVCVLCAGVAFTCRPVVFAWSELPSGRVRLE